MNTKQILAGFILCLLPAAGLVSCGTTDNKAQQSQPVAKQLHPWMICNEQSSFSEVEPVKDMIGSLSIFGNPTAEFLDECHKNGIEVYHAVGGNEASINTPEKVDSLIATYLEKCESGFDGIDLDFEHLDPDVQNTYSAFLRKASQQLHNAGKKMSHCVGYYPASVNNPDAKQFYDPAVLAETCDLVRVMCYDMYFAPHFGSEENDGAMGPTSDYPWTEEAMKFWKERIPAEKLVMALPAYGNDFALTGKLSGRQIYNTTPDSVQGELPEPVWMYYEKINMYLYDHPDGSRHLFYPSDSRSTAALLELAEKLEMPLIGFWHFGSVSDDMWGVTRDWFSR